MIRPSADDSEAEVAEPGNSAEMVAMRAELAALREEIATRDQRTQEDMRRHAQIVSQLVHRVRNTSALVRSVFERTIATTESLEEIEHHFCGRLGVLTRYQLPISLEGPDGVDLQRLIRDELQNHEFGNAPGITIAGPDVSIPLDQAQPLALVVHELATNALKFGALAVKGAALSIDWTLCGNVLELVWSETRLSVISAVAPIRRGFGRELIEDALPYQMGATATFTLRPGGIECRITLPLCPRAMRAGGGDPA